MPWVLKRGTNTPSIGHYEHPWTEDTVTVGSIVTPSAGPGTNVVFELDATNMFNTGATSGGSSIQTSYPVVGDVLELYDRTQVRVSNKNTAVTPHQLTVTPFDSTVDLAALVVVGQEYGIAYNLHAEGSGLPAGGLLVLSSIRTPLVLSSTALGLLGMN